MERLQNQEDYRPPRIKRRGLMASYVYRGTVKSKEKLNGHALKDGETIKYNFHIKSQRIV